MNLKRLALIVAIISITALASARPGFSEESAIRQGFIAAFEDNDTIKMTSVIEENKDRIPGEIKALLDEAFQPGATAGDREIKLYLAELMASAYKEVSDDYKPLLEVKKKSFDAKLSAPVRSTALNGVHTVDVPKAAGDVKNIFRPENIIIKKGETVKWVNNDETGHIFSTMGAISSGRFLSPNVEPGKSWEYKFEKPGQYFYICFIHQAMIGKVTVEE